MMDIDRNAVRSLEQQIDGEAMGLEPYPHWIRVLVWFGLLLACILFWVGVGKTAIWAFGV